MGFRKLLNVVLLISLALLFFIPFTFFNAYSEHCSDDKLCFREGDYFEVESNMYGEEPYARYISKSGGLTDDNQIQIDEESILLAPDLRSGETMGNGTVVWSKQSRQTIWIPNKYPYNDGYGRWVMFLPNMTIKDFEKLNYKVTEGKYEFKNYTRDVFIRTNDDTKMIVDKETGLVLYNKYYPFGKPFEVTVIDTNMFDNIQNSDSEKIIERSEIKTENTLPVNLKKYNKIPEWFNNTIQWYIDGSISEDEIISSLQFLVKEEIIKVNSNQNCIGNKICDTELVTKIVDGDTLYTKSYKIRLSLTNTPEKDKDGFSEATQFTANLCPVGSNITIDQDDLQPYDRYDRLVAKIFCGEKILNSELLYNNHANILTSYCKTSEFSEESWAKDFGC